ncbi:hypothetical protein GCM10009577_04950 [Streptomyces javensis]
MPRRAPPKAEHLSFEHLDAFDVSFDDARVPGQGEVGNDGIAVAVAVDAGGQGVQARQVVPADGVEPLREPLALGAR